MAALPIITAIIGVGTSAVTVMLLSHLITLSDTTLTLGSLIGLGVGIDYALFIVNRHRANLMSGMSVAESVAKSSTPPAGPWSSPDSPSSSRCSACSP